MKMTIDRFQELVTLNSLGALDGEDKTEFLQFMETADELSSAQVDGWNDIAAQLAHAAPVRLPDRRVKESLMRKIAERHATERSLEGPGRQRLDHAKGIYTVFPDEIPWSKHPVDGVHIKVLSESIRRGYVTMLMKVDPGTRFPEHHHTGEEECYVLSGSISLGGKLLGAGVLHRGDENSEHGTLSTEEGALLLLVVAKEDYISPVA
jgi:quercetin dioxygenase-like cupin family protein